MTPPPTIRWFWAYDDEGERISEPEPVGVRWDERLGTAVPVVDLVTDPAHRRRGRMAVVLRPREGRTGRLVMAGVAHSEFPPD